MRSEQIEFSGTQDTRLVARLDLLGASPQAFALFSRANQSESAREA